mgnify:CR=1 FL=1
MSRQVIRVAPDGTLQFIWDDALSGLRDAGRATIRRASDIEPDDRGMWVADMGRVGMPPLGPFSMRQDALAAEREVIETTLAAGNLQLFFED